MDNLTMRDLQLITLFLGVVFAVNHFLGTPEQPQLHKVEPRKPAPKVEEPDYEQRGTPYYHLPAEIHVLNEIQQITA